MTQRTCDQTNEYPIDLFMEFNVSVASHFLSRIKLVVYHINNFLCTKTVTIRLILLGQRWLLMWISYHHLSLVLSANKAVALKKLLHLLSFLVLRQAPEIVYLINAAATFRHQMRPGP
jgi:uncharacterized membrane protein